MDLEKEKSTEKTFIRTVEENLFRKPTFSSLTHFTQKLIYTKVKESWTVNNTTKFQVFFKCRIRQERATTQFKCFVSHSIANHQLDRLPSTPNRSLSPTRKNNCMLAELRAYFLKKSPVKGIKTNKGSWGSKL